MKIKHSWAFCWILNHLVILFLWPQLSFGQGAFVSDSEEIIHRTEAKISPEKFIEIMRMENIRPSGETLENELKCFRSGDRQIVLVTAPAIQQGQVILRDRDDMWMYLPKSKRLMRVGAKENSLGGEASNADLLRVDILADYDIVSSGIDTVDNDPCLKFELKGKRRTVAYDKIVYWISMHDELPKQREFYSLSGHKLKTMLFADPKTIGGKIIPSVVTIINAKNPDYKTVIHISVFDTRPSFGEEIFNPAYVKLEKLR